MKTIKIILFYSKYVVIAVFTIYLAEHIGTIISSEKGCYLAIGAYLSTTFIATDYINVLKK